MIKRNIYDLQAVFQDFTITRMNAEATYVAEIGDEEEVYKLLNLVTKIFNNQHVLANHENSFIFIEEKDYEIN